MIAIPISRILPNPEQPRRHFDQAELQGLADSIRENGLIQPIVVERAGDGYILHDGERRLRAAKLAGLEEIDAVVAPPSNGTASQDRLLRALVANIQRTDLTPIEEARAYARMRDEHSLNVVAIARRCGTYYARVYTRLKLLELDPEIQSCIEQGLHTDERVHKAIQSIPDRQARIEFARRVTARRMSIKGILMAANHLVKALAARPSGNGKEPPAVHIATRNARHRPAAWDALRQAGKLPPWPIVEQAAHTACSACLLAANASPEVCSQCPAPAMIQYMIERANARHPAR